MPYGAGFQPLELVQFGNRWESITGCELANRHHYELAAEALAQADPGWLADLITRQEPLGQWAYAYTHRPDDIKTILSFADESS